MSDPASRRFRVIQVTDSHLSDERPYFLANWRFCLEAVRSLAPDLLIHTGDLCLDAVNHPQELDAALSEMKRIGVPFRAVPGNHDVGDLEDPTIGSRERMGELRQAYRKRLGDDWWMEDHDAWRLVGINSQLFGTGLEAEDEQFDAFAGWLKDAGRSVAVFLHKPLFLRAPGEKQESWACVRPALRERYAEVLRSTPVKLVASGHLHLFRNIAVNGVSYVWGPSTAFVFNDGRTEYLGGSQSLGFLEYSFSPDGCSCNFHQPSELIRHDVTPWLNHEEGNGYLLMANRPYPRST